MSISFIPTLYAIAGGLAGYLMHLRQWTSGYLPDEQRFMHGQAASIALFVLTVVYVLLFATLLRRQTRDTATKPSALFTSNRLNIAVAVGGGLLFILAGISGLIDAMSQLSDWRAQTSYLPLRNILTLVLSAISAFLCAYATMYLSQLRLHGKSSERSGVLVLLPVISGLCWVFSIHTNNSTNPILLSYGILLAAAISLLLAHYEVAALFHTRAHPRRLMFFALLGIFLGCTALAAPLSRSDQFFLLAFMCCAFSYLQSMLYSAYVGDMPKRVSRKPRADGTSIQPPAPPQDQLDREEE